MNAFVILGRIIAIGTLILGADHVSKWATAGIFAASLVALVVVIVLDRQKQIQGSGKSVDYARLASINFSRMAPWLKENLRGHDAQVDEIATSVQEELAVARPGKIIGAYMLVGPPGTGKSFLGQLVGQALYPESKPVILPMNQYKHSDDVFTLLGPPPGRPGFEVGGSLTRPVLENPYRVIVLNELDEAHHDIHHCLYNILDEGTCTEKSSGKLVDFSGCVFVATGNRAAKELHDAFAQTEDPGMQALQSRELLHEVAGFDKAFLSRWTGIVLMDELEPIHIAEVALLKVCEHWKRFGMEITYVPPELLVEAMKRNTEFRAYGVRNLGKFVEEQTKHAIGQARAAKMTRVLLDISPDGKFIARPREAGASGGSASAQARE